MEKPSNYRPQWGPNRVTIGATVKDADLRELGLLPALAKGNSECYDMSNEKSEDRQEEESNNYFDFQ